LWGPYRSELASVEHGYTVGSVDHEIQIMRGERHGGAGQTQVAHLGQTPSLKSPVAEG
jgi:hypothetical protein